MIIDRFEGDMAVCENEDRTFVEIDRTLLPEKAKEGDSIKQEPDGQYTIDKELTKANAERIKKKMDSLWE